MTDQVFEMIQGMDTNDVDLQLALQCAPVLAGLKVSNLFIISREQIEKVDEILTATDIDSQLISYQGQRATVLLYRKEALLEYLNQDAVRSFLFEMGYEKLSLRSLFHRFRKRYIFYQQGRGEFPHEMGLFLGYPIEDVIGFIEHKGKDFKHSGYWKVYGNVREKISLFWQFDRAQELLIGQVSKGGSVTLVQPS
ncbi:MAG: DUF3793 family protein [Clostridiaceae bacterium]|nr:DUF3793 family protein [Clostridiaceae bacterium]